MFRRRPRQERRRCPKCGVGMRAISVEGVALDVCPACTGMWFDAGELSRAAGLAINESLTGQAFAGARRTRPRCLACAVPLYEREIERGTGIWVDQCANCGGLFLDKEEFSRVQAHFRAKGVRALPRRSAGHAEAPPLPTVSAESSLLQAFQYLTGLPLELDVPQRLFPPVVTALILANVAVFIAAAWRGLGASAQSFGLIGADIVAGRRLYTLLTAMFLHAGVVHLLGNMYFLYIAGDNVEERMGGLGFLAFYLGTGAAADLVQALVKVHAAGPLVGASGAVSAVLGAYLVWFPHARFVFRRLIRLGCVMTPARLEFPAFAYLGVWVLFQLLCGALDVPGVGWWAHLAGFACGATVACVSHLKARPGRSATSSTPARR